MEPTRQSRLEYLDGLRGLAALAVVFSHLASAFYPYWRTGNPVIMSEARWPANLFLTTPLNIFINGNFAVWIFYAHSGIVLSLSVFRWEGTKINLGRWLSARYLRLTIPVLFSILLAYLILIAGGMGNQFLARMFPQTAMWLERWYAFSPSLWDATQQGIFSTYFQYRPHTTYNSALWTMESELWGSVIVIAFLGLFRNSKYRWYLYPPLLLLVRSSSLLPFALGMVVADFYPLWLQKKESLRFRKLMILLFLGLGVWIGSIQSIELPWYSVFQYFPPWMLTKFPTLSAFLVIFSIMMSKRAQQFLCSRPVRFLGRHSFAIYLIHVPIICSLTVQLFLIFHQYFNYYSTTILSSVLTVVFVILVSIPVTKWIDEPAIRLSRRVKRGRLPLPDPLHDTHSPNPVGQTSPT